MRKEIHISDICLSDQAQIFNWKLALYFPVGILVLIARAALIVLFALVSFVVPERGRSFSFRLLRGFLGIRVSRNKSRAEIARVSARTVIVSNHISMLDALATLDAGRPILLRGTALRGSSRLEPHIFSLLERLSGARFISYEDKRGLASLFKSWKEGADDSCLFIPAEMTINNGRGLFRFNPGLMSRGFPVIPQAMRLTTSFGVIAHPFLSGGLYTLLRLLMLPYVKFDIALLPAMQQQEEESPQDFADRVQKAVADDLGIPATQFTVADKHVYRRSVREAKLSISA
ncbi:hypothetical protein [Ottowia thiooxydans]|uniref:Phospholipid/glycerol acyltransferase domain-containing protein n=1 Tax=Ottowia thiooxydans TaxID=219182 RepID=A0ABV2QIA8_9BURK